MRYVNAERLSATPFLCQAVNSTFQSWSSDDYSFEKACEEVILKSKTFSTPAQIYVLAQVMLYRVEKRGAFGTKMERL